MVVLVSEGVKMVVLVSEGGEVANGQVRGKEGVEALVEVLTVDVIDVASEGATVPKVVVTAAPLPGRNNRLCIRAVDT